MNEISRVIQFQRLIKPASMSDEDVFTMYATKLVPEEIGEALSAKSKGNKIKEACDVIVTLVGLDGDAIKPSSYSFGAFIYGSCVHYLDCLIGPEGTEKALKAVNDSNFSKLVLEYELDSEIEYFNEKGIKVKAEPLGDGFFGLFSEHDQTVSGKFYPAGKLLKPSKYSPVDEKALEAL